MGLLTEKLVTHALLRIPARIRFQEEEQNTG